MSVEVLHSHAVDSLLRAHRSDAARLPAPAVSRYTREEIIAAIQRWQQHYGEPPKVFDWDPSWARRRGEEWRAERFEEGDWPTVAIVRRQFGNMSKALFAAGIRPRRGPTRARSHTLSDDAILDAIREWTELYSEPPAIADWSPARARRAGQLWRLDRYYAGNWPSTNTVVRRFGTFSEAVAQGRAGAAPARAPHRRRADDPGRRARGHPAPARTATASSCGPAVLAARVRSVAAAKTAQDPTALRGALIDLAAAALSWADVVTPAPESRPLRAWRDGARGPGPPRATCVAALRERKQHTCARVRANVRVVARAGQAASTARR